MNSASRSLFAILSYMWYFALNSIVGCGSKGHRLKIVVPTNWVSPEQLPKPPNKQCAQTRLPHLLLCESVVGRDKTTKEGESHSIQLPVAPPVGATCKLDASFLSECSLSCLFSASYKSHSENVLASKCRMWQTNSRVSAGKTYHEDKPTANPELKPRHYEKRYRLCTELPRYLSGLWWAWKTGTTVIFCGCGLWQPMVGSVSERIHASVTITVTPFTNERCFFDRDVGRKREKSWRVLVVGYDPTTFTWRLWDRTPLGQFAPTFFSFSAYVSVKTPSFFWTLLLFAKETRLKLLSFVAAGWAMI